LALIFSLQINGLMAQQHQFTSVEEIWTYALIHNPENSIYQLKIEQAKEDKRNANSYIYPKITAGFSGQKTLKPLKRLCLVKYWANRVKRFI